MRMAVLSERCTVDVPGIKLRSESKDLSVTLARFSRSMVIPPDLVCCQGLSPLFAALTKTAGVWGYSSHFGTPGWLRARHMRLGNQLRTEKMLKKEAGELARIVPDDAMLFEEIV